MRELYDFIIDYELRPQYSRENLTWPEVESEYKNWKRTSHPHAHTHDDDVAPPHY